MRMYKIYILGFLLLFPLLGISQQDSLYNAVKAKIYKLSEEVPALNSEVNISVTDVSIQELFRSLANNAGLNIDVDPKLNFNVINNFSGVKVKDVLVFLQTKYNLEYKFIGNIITVYGPVQVVQAEGKNQVFYDFEKDLLTLEYASIDLKKAVKQITEFTGRNVILDPGVPSNNVYGFIKLMPFENALEKFAFTNGLQMKKTEDGFYILFKEAVAADGKESKPVSIANYSGVSMNDFSFLQEKGVQLDAVNKDSINIYAINVPRYDLIKLVSNKLKINYFIHSGNGNSSSLANSQANNSSSRSSGSSSVSAASSVSTGTGDNVSLNVVGISYDEFLEYLFNGSQETYRKKDGIYLIGSINIDELRDWRIIQLQHRTIDSLKNLMPEKLIDGIEFQHFVELNSVFLGGPSYKLDKVQAFIREIDKPVPVIMIEVIIMNVSKTFKISTGIQAGLGTPPTKEKGNQIFPAVDYTLSSTAINDLINKFNGFGSINLGNVTPDFYMNLKAMEEQGILDVESTPKLSTLNGHKATLKIGNTEYYKEVSNQVQGNQSPIVSNSFSYKEMEANLKIEIMPIVSGDNQITLELKVIQADFTNRVGDQGPYGKVEREFVSTIRVKNQDMVLLGGLEEKRKNDSGTGFPILSRIPILKWFFSSKEKEDSKAKLNIFIKPTIIN